MIDKSPCGAIRRPIRDNSKPPSILSVKAANELLYVAQRRDPEFAKYFAIGIFAGVRPHEIERLDEKDITERYIEITAANAKCRKRRLVNVLPNLKEWLKVSPTTPLKNKRRRKLALIKAAGISWSHDIMRHSYASYHLAHFSSADKTALEMGHRDTNMLFRHYRQLVTKEDAEKYWEIMPRRTILGKTKRVGSVIRRCKNILFSYGRRHIHQLLPKGLIQGYATRKGIAVGRVLGVAG